MSGKTGMLVWFVFNFSEKQNEYNEIQDIIRIKHLRWNCHDCDLMSYKLPPI